MTDQRPTHRVSVKAVLFNMTGTQVLVTRQEKGHYGLPGGHVEAGESPDDALRRELLEELGIVIDKYGFTRHDFWREKDGGRIILSYIAYIPEDISVAPLYEEMTGAEWITRNDIAGGRMASDVYDEYLLSTFAPTAIIR